MKRIAFDIEANGYLHEATKIHSLVLKDIDTGEVLSCVGDHWAPGAEGYTPLIDGLAILADADLLIAHFGIGYDVPLLKKLEPQLSIKEDRVIDTLAASHVLYPNLNETDRKLLKQGTLPGKLFGSHSLEAWGFRKGVHKQEHKDWTEWSPEMQKRCEQDVEILSRFFLEDIEPCLDVKEAKRAIDNEHGASWACADINVNGFRLNVKEAGELYATLAKRRAELETKLKTLFPPWEENDGKPFICKRDDKKRGRKEGDLIQKTKMVEFNPLSREHIRKKFVEKYGWKPKQKTPSGLGKIDDDVLNSLPYPEAKPLAELFMLDKRIGQIAEGNGAWLKLERNGRVHGSVNPSGTRTSRASHSDPNMSQVVAVKSPYGKECRKLWLPEEGKLLLGVDLSGVQARGLGHYLHPYDGGAYCEVALRPKPDDIHAYNARLLEIEPYKTKPPRDIAKTWLYARFFGALEGKLGEIINPELGPKERRKVGLQSMQRFSTNIEGMRELEESMDGAYKRKGIYALDGRFIPSTQRRLVLCDLLQSFEASIAKRWLGLIRLEPWYGTDFKLHLWSHDEIQGSVTPGLEKEIGERIVRLATVAGEGLGSRCLIEAEAKVGTNWLETH